MRIAEKIKNKSRDIRSYWKADLRFSKKYAVLRLKEIIFAMLRMNNLSNLSFHKREQYLIEYIKNDIDDTIKKYKRKEYIGNYIADEPIWVCWWTGLETAPPIVKQCVKSIYRNSNNHKVNLITQDNYFKYVDVPDYIMNKMVQGLMGLAHFTDYLRVCLIEKYGGLWLDATIFCSEQLSNDYFTLPFFTLKSPYRETRYISKYRWTTFCLGGWRHNQFFLFMKDALEEYWLKNDYAIDYLFFDYIISIARDNNVFIRDLMDAVAENTPHRDDLQAAMNAALPAEQFENVINKDTTLYKLSWRETYSELTADGKPSIYNRFLNLKNFEDDT